MTEVFNTDRILVELEALKQRDHMHALLHAFKTECKEKFTIEEISWSITKNVIGKLNFEDCVLYYLNEDTQCMEQVAAHGPKNQDEFLIIDKLSIPLGKGIVGTVAQTGIAEIIADTSKDPRYIVDDVIRYSEITVPIKIDNKVVGVIDAEHHNKNYFNSYHLELLMSIASFAADKFLNIRMYQKLEEQNNSLEQIVKEKTKLLQSTIAKLKRSNGDLRNYAHVVSHDLKQPLRTINNFIQLIGVTEKSLSEKSKDYMKYISKASAGMTKLLDDILDYASLNGSEIKEVNIDLNIVLATVIHNLIHQIESNDCQITYDKLPIVKGIESLLIQLFQNLVSNAIKFRQPDQPCQIDIKYFQKSDHHLILIKDNGIGIDEDSKEVVFQLFKKLNSNSKYEGTGLGLSLCKRIMEKHEGNIKIDSKGLGHGIEVSLFFKTMSNDIDA